jgi:hypothetical protein
MHGGAAGNDLAKRVIEGDVEKISSDYIGFRGGDRYPPNEADANKLCSQLS